MAWLTDLIIVSIGLGILFASISLPFWIAFPQWFESTNMNMAFRNAGPFNYIISSLVFMAYWTYFESSSGQSTDKKLMRLKTTDLGGRNIDASSAVTAFLLPLDVEPDPNIRFNIKHGMWTVGINTSFELIQGSKNYTIKNVSQNIKGPTLVLGPESSNTEQHPHTISFEP
ncbi:MAG TPA: RDD family protein [Candidatus Nitrosopolaris sp.]|nr:RDD family protein [Candidatus Nitrosopolaris sp.]